MSLPVGSEHAAAETAAVPAPRTFRNSRRLTPGVVELLISVVAVRAVVARLLAIAGGRGGRGGVHTLGLRGLLRLVPGGLLAFLRDVAVHVTAHAPAHVQAGVLIDLIHLLDLAVTRLAGDA